MNGRDNQPDNPARTRERVRSVERSCCAAAGALRRRQQAFCRRDRGRRRLARHLPGRIFCAARAVRLRQDHAAADARGLRDAGCRPCPARWRGSDRRAAASPAGQHDVPELRAVSASHRRGQCCVRAQAGRPAESTRSTRALPRCWRCCGSKASKRASRISCPAASASAWRSRARWSSARACCCSTSRSRRSTRSCAARPSSS